MLLQSVEVLLLFLRLVALALEPSPLLAELSPCSAIGSGALFVHLADVLGRAHTLYNHTPPDSETEIGFNNRDNGIINKTKGKKYQVAIPALYNTTIYVVVVSVKISGTFH